jgi:hypothetical protein
VWALELLICLRRKPDRVWQSDELVRELRTSSTVICDSLTTLQHIGFVATTDAGGFRYAPVSGTLIDLAEGAERLYREKPVMVVSAIAAMPNEKLRIFAEAFRLKDKK